MAADRVTLEFLGEQLRRLLAERQADRADMLTIVSMIQRIENTLAPQVAGIGQQLTAMHAFNRAFREQNTDELQRIGDRLAALESKPTTD